MLTENEPKVSVIIPTRRRFSPLINTLKDLLVQEYGNFEIIIGDQNSLYPEEFKDIIETLKSDSKINWLYLPLLGVAQVRNELVKNSSGDILLFIDDDVLIPNPKFIHNHISNYRDLSISAVVGRECSPKDKNLPVNITHSEYQQSTSLTSIMEEASPLQQALWFSRNIEQRCKICSFCTCNSSIRRNAFLSIGGFDINLSFSEDYDLGLRLHKEKGIIVYDPTAWLIHLRAQEGGLRLTDPKNPVDMKAITCGLRIFLLRHGYRGMYMHLLYKHVLRKTLFLKRNVVRPWHQIPVIFNLIWTFFKAFNYIYQK